ncbi:MAG: hypothetical protein H0U95_06060 [Bacteroidetes bacterium]|nr:hypothetical protein [Bacteroidota bacterium]
MIRIITILIFVFIVHSVSAQNDTIVLGKDTTTQTKSQKKAIYSSARKASIMSAIIPGLGQVYNKKYWKVPIIYAGIGGFGYMFLSNNTKYNDYRTGLIASVNHGDSSQAVYGKYYSQTQLQTQKLYYRKYRDFAIIGIGIIYLINIIDANVDAHLRTFDVSDDVSLQIDPWQNTYSTASGLHMATGLSIKLNFK